MKVLTIASQKGGVGKTTVALNLAYAMAQRGWRILLVESDPQGAVGLSLSPKVSGASGLAEFIANGTPVQQLIIQTRLDNLHILPVGQLAMQDTAGFEQRLLDGSLMKRLINLVSQQYDVLMVDTPSGFGGATMGALRASTHVLTPLQAEPLALRSLPKFLEVVAALRKEGASSAVVGVVLTMLQLRNVNSLTVAEEMWAEMPPGLVFEAHVPRDAVFLEATAAGVPVGLLRRRPPAVAQVFDQIAAELEGKIGLLPEEVDDGPQPLLV